MPGKRPTTFGSSAKKSATSRVIAPLASVRWAPRRPYLGLHAALLEERPRRLLHELDPHHRVAPIGQPAEVVALSAQGDQHARGRRRQQVGVRIRRRFTSGR